MFAIPYRLYPCSCARSEKQISFTTERPERSEDDKQTDPHHNENEILGSPS
jgi:hypothetical protein